MPPTRAEDWPKRDALGVCRAQRANERERVQRFADENSRRWARLGKGPACSVVEMRALHAPRQPRCKTVYP